LRPKSFVLLVIVLLALTVFTSHPLLAPLLATPEPTSTPIPLQATPTLTPTATLDPFGTIPTPTSQQQDLHQLNVDLLPSPALSDPPTATATPFPTLNFQRILPTQKVTPSSNTRQNISHPPIVPISLASASVHSPLQGWPVSGRLTQAFGCSQYYTGIRGPNCNADQPWFHDGLDLATWSGAPVRAALTGIVTFAGADGVGPRCGGHQGYGLGVVIDSGDDWQALFAHLAEVDVSVGQQVGPDTVIGTVGDTGCTSGAHLHFSLKHNGRLVDPLKYLPTPGAAAP